MKVIQKLEDGGDGVMLFPLFLSMFLGIFGRPCCHIYNKDIAYKIISIFLSFLSFFSLILSFLYDG